MLALVCLLDSYSRQLCQSVQAEYTLDLLDMNDDYHMDVIRTKLTRNIGNTFKDVRDELLTALDASIPVSGDGTWRVSIEMCTLSSCGMQIGSRFPL